MYPPNQEAYVKIPSNPSAPPSQPKSETGIPVASYNDNPQYPPPQGRGQEGPWSTGLCDCCADRKTCCLTCWCPCIAFGRIAEIVDQGNTSCGTAGALYGILLWLTGCGCPYSCGYRSKLRRQYMLPETPCNDCMVHCCCESCALCQEYRELQTRGFDMSIGWHANMDRQNLGVPIATAPVFEGGMTR